MNGDVDRTAMIEQSVDDMGRLAIRDGNRLGVEGGIAARNVSVEGNRRPASFVRVDGAVALGSATEREVLAIGTGHGAVAEADRQGMGLLGGYDPCEGASVAFLADIPAGGPGELAVAGHCTGFRHPREPEVGRVGQHGRQNYPMIFRRHPGSQMGEAICQPGPARHLLKQFGDAHAGHRCLYPVGQTLRRIGSDRLQRGDLQRGLGNPYV